MYAYDIISHHIIWSTVPKKHMQHAEKSVFGNIWYPVSDIVKYGACKFERFFFFFVKKRGKTGTKKDTPSQVVRPIMLSPIIPRQHPSCALATPLNPRQGRPGGQIKFNQNTPFSLFFFYIWCPQIPQLLLAAFPAAAGHAYDNSTQDDVKHSSKRTGVPPMVGKLHAVTFAPPSRSIP